MTKLRTFEREVALLYSSLGYKVLRDRSRTGQKFDITLETVLPGIGTQLVSVECRVGHRPLSRSSVKRTIEAFESSDDAGNELSGQNRNLVIVSQSGFTEPAIDLAKQLSISCISVQDLAVQVFDPDRYLRRLVSGGQSNDYVDLDLEVHSQRASESAKTSFTRAFDYWLASKTSTVFLLTGMAGMGKSFMIEWQAIQLAQRSIDGKTGTRIPILIRLDSAQNSTDLIELVISELNLRYDRETARKVVESQIKSGSLILLIDELDALRISEQKEVLYQIDELSSSNSTKILAASRSIPRDWIGEKSLSVFMTKYVHAEIQPLSLDQITKMPSPSGGNVEVSHSQPMSSLASFARTPMFIHFLETSQSESDFTRAGFDSAILENIFEKILKRETIKSGWRNSFQMEDLARISTTMELQGKTEVNRQETLNSLDGRSMHVRGFSIFFSESDGEKENLSFSHRSIMDFFVAYSIFHDVNGCRNPLLTHGSLNSECVEFLIGYGLDDRTLNSWEKELKERGNNVEIGRENIDSIRLAFKFDTGLERNSVKVRSIFLKNIRCFDEIEIMFGSNNEFPEITLLVGNNGVGKSTISQCIALCSLGPELAGRVVSRPSQLLSSGSDTGFMKCCFEVKQQNGLKEVVTISIKVSKNRKMFDLVKAGKHSSKNWQNFLAETIDTDNKGYFVAAYGPTRNLNLAGDPKLHSWDKVDFNRVGSMFDQTYSLIDPESLRRILMGDGGPFDQFGAPSVLPNSVSRPVSNILLSLLPTDELAQFTEDGQFVSDFGPVDFSQLSDGYRSTLAWAGHLVVSLLQYVEWRSDITRVAGVVLVDEIDLHLHPKWQRSILTRLSKAFPNIQFILSSHSPLVVADADANQGRTILLTKIGERVCVEDDLPDYNGWRADQILASRAFGYLIDRDPQTEAALQELSKLSGKGPQRTASEQSRYLELVSHWGIERMVDGQTEVERKLQVEEFRSIERRVSDAEKRLFGQNDD